MIQIFTLEPSKSVHNGEFQPPNSNTEVSGLFEKMIAFSFSFGHNQKSIGVRSGE